MNMCNVCSVYQYSKRVWVEFHRLVSGLSFLFLCPVVALLALQTVAGSTLAAMKSNPKANIYGAARHLRKGGAGGWRNMFTVRESEAFDDIYRQQMKESTLKMDFGEGLVM